MTSCLSLQEKQLNIIKLLKKHCDNGQLKETLTLLSLLEGTEDIKLFPKPLQEELKNLKNHISMQEFLQENKKETLKPKLPFYEKNTHTTSSFQTLVLESTKNEKVIKPFWTKFSAELSKKLWLPTKTAYQGSVLTYSNQYVQNLELKLLSQSRNQTKMDSKNSQKILCPSLPFLQPDIMGGVNIKYSRKIRIYPNVEQLELFKQCFGATRYIYNKGVEHVNNCYKKQLEMFKLKALDGCIYTDKKNIRCENKTTEKNFHCIEHKNEKIKWKLPLSLSTLRPLIMKNDKDFKNDDDEKWQKNIPYDTRQLSLKSLLGNYKACITNKKRGNIEKFQLGFKSKKDPNHVFFINKKALKDFKIFKRKLKTKSKLKVRKRHNVYSNYTPKHDSIILKEGYKYYIIIPKKRDHAFEKSIYNSVSLDPGIRTFQTYYSPEGICGKIGNGLGKLILNLSIKIDKFKSLMSKKLGKTKRNMKKRCSLLRTKIKNITKDLHWQSCSFLVKNFQNIIIPQFGSKNMSKKSSRNIHKTTVRSMFNLSHFKFLEKLKFKCKEYQRNLIISSEEYTSKTCGNCGNLNNNLGGSENYKCSKCNNLLDRDINAARNILIKYFTG